MNEEQQASERKFVRVAMLVVAVLAALPALLAFLTAPAGTSYVGYQYNTDDHMVYAAWMRQAMDGHFFFDNRFTTDAQPGLTVNVYFFLLGLIAKVTGIAIATTLARIGFSVLFVWLVSRLIRKLEWEVYASKLALTLTVLGGGLGFLVWQNFGTDITISTPFAALMFDHLPTDVWQPEGYVFPSMLTNSLFMVSLCLILTAFISFLDARERPKAIVPGMLALAVLMNIHSYDVLMIAAVMVGFLGASLMRKQVTGAWVGRAVVIACGPIPAAAWFIYVLRNDAVFQSRAATETYAPNFTQIVFGYLPLILFALVGAWQRETAPEDAKRRRLGIGLAALLYLVLFALATQPHEKYFMGAPGFVLTMAVAIAAVVLASDENPAWNLLFSWATIGTVVVYFPALFQRKLAMGLSVPWAILAAFGLAALLRKQERSSRNLVMALGIILLGATSVRWLTREMYFSRADVANTLRHPVYFTRNVREILDYLDKQPEKKVVLALPGSGTPVIDETTGKPVPDAYMSPALPDLAPFASGLTGAYTYAGHWSETPDYGAKCADMYRFFFREPFQSVHAVMSDADRQEFKQKTGANYAILPVQDSYPTFPLVTPETLGTVVVDGPQFRLIKLR